MAVDLSDLIPSLQREVSAPGLDQVPDATNADYLGNLQDSFWDAFLDGAIVGYTESDGIVTPTSGTTDLPRELQQLVVFYAGMRIIKNLLRNTNTGFRTKAGPVEFETQQSAQLLTALLKDMQDRRLRLIDALVEALDRSTYYFDGVQARAAAMADGYVYWIDG